ncbi:MAG TPA: NTP/NDP exchange transporter [Gammaproteobacteria bacterium]|nr:NTP/NDP exchange transporter [Gammaproteobacteria bacterium]
MDANHFGRLRRTFWPIHNYELKKLLPMLFMFFFISFNYSVVRNIKDALIVTAPGSGAETIPYLKVWGVIPAAVIFMLIYAKLSNILSKPKLFYASVIPFILFFILFDLVLYPMQDTLHPHTLAAKWQADAPGGFYYFIAMFRNWSFSLFYILAELWGSVVLSLLFWGFANDTTAIEESKRFYALFGIGANLALEVSGLATGYFARVQDNVAPGVDPMQYTLNGLIGTFVVCGILIMIIYWWINKYVLTDARFYDPTKIKQKDAKPKMSLGESFKFLTHSKYMLYIAILVVAYGISINLIEVTWKSQVRLQYPSMNEYLQFMGSYNRCVAWTTIFMMLFVTGNVLRIFGWRTAALITPTILLVTGIMFFALVMYMDKAQPMVEYLAITPLYAAVLVGLAQNVVSKSAKYALFDPTKEMTYIPLDQESKVKGKAAIDVVGSRLGKAGGSLLQQGLFFIGPLSVITPYIAAVIFVIIVGWMVAAYKLGHEFAVKSRLPDS